MAVVARHSHLFLDWLCEPLARDAAVGLVVLDEAERRSDLPDRTLENTKYVLRYPRTGLSL
jgi:hypothetical protein